MPRGSALIRTMGAGCWTGQTPGEPIAYLREIPQAKPRASFPDALRINENKFGNLS